MFEAYSVAVRISLVDKVTSGLLGLSKSFKKTHADATQLQRQLDTIKRTMLVGGGMMMAGGGMLALVGKTVKAAEGYANQLALINQLGMQQKDIAATVQKAWQTAYDVPTSTISENLKSFRELRSAFGAGGEREAMMMLPTVARVSGILTALTGREQERVGFDMVKAAELRSPGVMTDAILQRNADLETRALIAMGGTITAADFHGAFKMGKMATQKWSDEFAYSLLPTLMQELKTASGGGAQSAGTYLQTFYRQVHGRVQKSAIPYWEMAGLINPSDVVKTSTGMFQIKPGAVKGLGMFENNPFDWVQQVLAPGVQKIMAKSHVSAETAINAMFSDRNAAFVAYNMYSKAAQYQRDERLIGQANSLGAYNSLLKTSPQLAFMALEKQWQNIMATLGYSIMPEVLKATQALIPILRDFTKWANEHQGSVRNFMNGLVLVGGALTALGGVLVASSVANALGLLFKLFGGPLGAAAEKGMFRMLPALSGVFTKMPMVTTALTALSSVPFLAITTGLFMVGIAAKGLYDYVKETSDQRWANTQHRWGGKAPFRPFFDQKGFGWGDFFGSAVNPWWNGPDTPFVGGGRGGTQVHVHNKVDKDGLTTMVLDHAGRRLGLYRGPTGFDPTYSAAPVGMGYGW